MSLVHLFHSAIILSVFCAVSLQGQCDTLESLTESCTEQNTYSMGYCTGYLNAIVDYLGQPKASAEEKYAICFPKLTNQMLFDALRRGSVEHPDLQSHNAADALITAFQESFPCDPKKRERVKKAERREQHQDFLTKCAALPIEPPRGKEAACRCMLLKLGGRVDLTSAKHAANASFLFAAKGEDLEKEIADYSKNHGFNTLGIDRIYMLALSACFRHAVAARPVLELVHYGVFLDQSDVSTSPDLNSPTGLQRHSDFRRVCFSERIPAELGVSFGIGFQIHGLNPSKKLIPVTVTTTHPPIIGVNGQETTKDVWETTTGGYRDGAQYGAALFSFEKPYEVKEGDWTIAVSAYGQTVKKDFRVRKGIPLTTKKCEEL